MNSTKTKPRARAIAFVVTLCMVIGLLPTTVHGVTLKDDFAADGKVNQTTADTIIIKYGGTDWYVIGNGTTGAAVNAGALTLLARDTMGSSKFGSQISSHVYAESSLKTTIEAIAGAFTPKEQEGIKARTLGVGVYNANVDCDGVETTEVTGAKLWPLSTKEAKGVNVELRKSSELWWLRSPGFSAGMVAYVLGFYGEVSSEGQNVPGINSVRPAFHLDLTSVLFASPAVGGISFGEDGIENFAESPSNTTNAALSLRFDDATVLSSNSSETTSYASITTSGSAVTYTAPADSVLVAEVKVGKGTEKEKIYHARKNIKTATTGAILDLATLRGLPAETSITGKVWIEKMENTADNKGLIYAIPPVEVSYTAPKATPSPSDFTTSGGYRQPTTVKHSL